MKAVINPSVHEATNHVRLTHHQQRNTVDGRVVVPLAPGWDERMADCIVVSILVSTYGRAAIPLALIFAAESAVQR